MSSWVHDWEAALIPRVNGVKAKARTVCKLGRHLTLEGVPMVWLSGPHPLGLSCLECAEPVAPEAVAAERERLARPKAAAPAARKKRGREHGKPGTYSAGCRCTPCREAASAAQAVYRANRRARRAAELAGAPA
jgi:hypothetical protein